MPACILYLVEVLGEIRNPLLLRLLLQHFAVADDCVERRAQLVTHVGQEHRLGAIGRIGLFHRLLEFGLPLLELGNIGEHADGATVRRAALADARPNLVIAVFGRAFRIGVMGEPLGDPFLGRAPLQIDHPTIDNGAQDGWKRRARHHQVVDLRIKLAEFAVTQHEPVLRVVKHKALGDRLDGSGNHTPLTLGLGGEPLTLHDALAEQLERSRHRADLAAPHLRNRSIQPAGSHAIDRCDDRIQRHQNRAEHDPGEAHPEHNRDCHDDVGHFRGPRDVRHDLIACADNLGVQILDQAREAVVDGHAMLACLGKRRITHDALVLGILLDRAVGRLIELGNLLLQQRRDFGPAACEDIELLDQPVMRCFRIYLRLAQEADSEIRYPIAVLAERVAHVLCNIDELRELGVAGDGLRVVSKLTREIERGRRDHDDQRARQQQQPDLYTEICEHSRGLCDVRRSSPRSTVERDAHDTAQVALVGALLRIPGDVNLPLRAPMAGEARRSVILRYRDAEGGPSAAGCDRGEQLPFWPARRQQLVANDFGLPIIGPSLAVAHEVERRGDLHLGLAAHAFGKGFVDQTAERGRNECFEANPGLIDRLLIGIHDLGNGVHLRAQQAAVA